jgi:hypothetical protein
MSAAKRAGFLVLPELALKEPGDMARTTARRIPTAAEDFGFGFGAIGSIN